MSPSTPLYNVMKVRSLGGLVSHHEVVAVLMGYAAAEQAAEEFADGEFGTVYYRPAGLTLGEARDKWAKHASERAAKRDEDPNWGWLP